VAHRVLAPAVLVNASNRGITLRRKSIEASSSPRTPARGRSGAPGGPLAERAFRRYLCGSGILPAELIMRRTLVFLLGIWAFTAPSACLALCSEPSTAAEFGTVAAEQPKAPCHQTAPDDRGAQDPEPAPEPGDGCCLEQQPGLIQASAPEPRRAPLVFAFRTASEIAIAIAPTTVSPLLLRTSRIHTPYLQSNPPLLI
jgi:hypothetical protein